MTNEQIVDEIRKGYSVTNNMQWLYQRNLPLIKQFIKPYLAYEELEDLLQEAYFGLWEAVQRYETSENVLFMTYAEFWIRNAVRKHIEKCGAVIRLPGNIKQNIMRYKKCVQRLTQEHSATPTDEEIADYMNVDISEIEKYKLYAQSVFSIDTPVYDDTETTIRDSLQSEYDLENDIVDKVYKEHSKSELWGIVERHTIERENHIIREHFLYNKPISEIAREENLTARRVRFIKDNALRRLRYGKAKRELLEKFEIAECGIYRGGYGRYSEHNFTSTVEDIVLRRAEIQEEYERRMGEIAQKRACL